ncbi:MAG: hypothetical protein ACOVQ7_02105 [Limnoraphis robusta]
MTTVPDEGFAVVTHCFSPKESELTGEKTVQQITISEDVEKFLSLPSLYHPKARRNPRSDRSEVVNVISYPL